MSAGGRGGDDVGMTLAILLIVMVGAGWAIWYFFAGEILEILRYIRLGEIWVLDKITGDHGNWIKYLKSAHGAEKQNLANTGFTAAELASSTQLVTMYLRWPTAVILGGIGVYALFYSPRGKFRSAYDLEGLMRIQAKVWPVISPILKVNPTKISARAPGQAVPDELPLFAEALSPEEWIAHHHIKVVNGIPEREAVRKAFLAQLGPRWHGTDALPDYMKALFAAFALKGGQKRKESDDFLGEIALCWSPSGGFNMTGEVRSKMNAIMRDPETGGKATEIARNFAYRTTAMLGVLKWARFMGGVLAPAQFLWLRGADRELGYPLNNLGRRAFHTEGAGAMAHYMAEEAAQKPLPIPRIDTAIVTLNQYMANSQAKVPPVESKSSRKSRSK